MENFSEPISAGIYFEKNKRLMEVHSFVFQCDTFHDSIRTALEAHKKARKEDRKPRLTYREARDQAALDTLPDEAAAHIKEATKLVFYSRAGERAIIGANLNILQSFMDGLDNARDHKDLPTHITTI